METDAGAIVSEINDFRSSEIHVQVKSRTAFDRYKLSN
ncbi:hypothetical protein SAMCFNEI73_Ch2597 [Sinorhizobium americanum]|uniref:Uncharacterized protein n=1 Tax=Sinorhizobium americanum TaxID=194963 RepID=A0A1L3LP76_9HYPH|nr:hypothetical protein SAMCFNEI73_Ch2597 [Sinorhizobium americanum]